MTDYVELLKSINDAVDQISLSLWAFDAYIKLNRKMTNDCVFEKVSLFTKKYKRSARSDIKLDNR